MQVIVALIHIDPCRAGLMALSSSSGHRTRHRFAWQDLYLSWLGNETIRYISSCLSGRASFHQCAEDYPELSCPNEFLLLQLYQNHKWIVVPLARQSYYGYYKC